MKDRNFLIKRSQVQRIVPTAITLLLVIALVALLARKVFREDGEIVWRLQVEQSELISKRDRLRQERARWTNQLELENLKATLASELSYRFKCIELANPVSRIEDPAKRRLHSSSKNGAEPMATESVESSFVSRAIAEEKAKLVSATRAIEECKVNAARIESELGALNEKIGTIEMRLDRFRKRSWVSALFE